MPATANHGAPTAWNGGCRERRLLDALRLVGLQARSSGVGAVNLVTGMNGRSGVGMWRRGLSELFAAQVGGAWCPAVLRDSLLMRSWDIRRLVAVWIATVVVVFGAADVAGASSRLSRMSPDTAGSAGSLLTGVSCTSRTACIAVGSYYKSSGGYVSWTLAERWNGTRWSILHTPKPPLAVGYPTGSELTGVSCASSTACIAIGDYADRSGQFVELVERWDGTRWSIQRTPNPPGTTDSHFDGVSCTSSTACTAAGEYTATTDFGNKPLLERWDGTNWSVQQTPKPVGSDWWLGPVSCTSSTACTVLGSVCCNNAGWDDAFALGWDGSSWSTSTTPRPPSAVGSRLDGVSCTSSAACVAVGQYQQNSNLNSSTLAERWNGASWSIVPTPDPPGASDPGLSGVSCTSSAACIAVGSYNNSDDRSFAFAERWDGTRWLLQATPNRASADGSLLYAVSCTSSTACTAVGSDGHSPLVERWDGAKWVVQTPPLPSNRFTLSAIRARVDGTVSLRIKLPGPGRVDVLETAWKDDLARTALMLQPAPRRFVFARKHAPATHAGVIQVAVVPGRLGRLLVAHPRYRISLRLWVSYTPLDGRPRTEGLYGLHLPEALTFVGLGIFGHPMR